MSRDNFIHETRLSTTDEGGHRVILHPEDVKGKWRDRRTVFYWFLIVIYLVVPWIEVGGKQIILLDVVHREFVFFGTTFFSHDTPLFFFVLIGWVFAFAFLTVIWGRVWCGWACPQTVFIDAIYRKIETWVEGNARKRRKDEKMPMTPGRWFRRGLKWFLYLIVSLHIVHSFLGYFVGARKLFWITLSPPTEHMTLFIIMLFCTAVIMLDFGWFREQFCIIMCPYGRLQSIMMDTQTKTIVYDHKRGEPRRGTVERANEGDCIDCNHCVLACPTGIDIRKGTQLECISCTACVDACDEIMTKVDRPTGLIRYDSEDHINGKKQQFFRPRMLIYLAIFAVVIGAFVTTLNTRNELGVVYTRGTRAPFTVSNAIVTNFFRVHLTMKSEGGGNIRFDYAREKGLHDVQLVMPRNPLMAKQGKNKINLFLKFPRELLKDGERRIVLQVFNEKNTLLNSQEVKLVGPYDAN